VFGYPRMEGLYAAEYYELDGIALGMA
jgi:hypothetical protein